MTLTSLGLSFFIFLSPATPILFIIATWLVLAWKVAGWWGLDRWILPLLGTPWRPGVVFKSRPGEEAPEQQPSHA